MDARPFRFAPATVVVALPLFALACKGEPPPEVVPAPAVPSSPAVREVTIATAPVNAKVLLEGAELGTTPYVMRLGESTTIQLRAAGYVQKSVMVGEQAGPNLVVQLEPLPTDAHAPGAVDPVAVAGEPDAGDGSGARTAGPPRATAGAKAAPAGADAAAAASSALPYSNVASAKADYQAGKIDRARYDQAVRKLKTRRTTKLQALKKLYAAGSIDRSEYQRRKRIIDNEYRG